jgi:hypothetical protein
MTVTGKDILTPGELSLMADAIAKAEAVLDLSQDSAPELTKLRIASIILDAFQAGIREVDELAARALEAVRPVLTARVMTRR